MKKLQPPSRSIPSLDGLRAIAVLMVIASHLGVMRRIGRLSDALHLGIRSSLLQIDIGDLGVSIFFVISGYLITTLLITEAREKGTISLSRFYQRRSFRIFPPYYCYLLTVVALRLAKYSAISRGSLISAMFYVSNYYSYVKSRPGSTGWLVGHTWSLSLEEQFYLLWPLSLRYLGQRRSAYVALLLILAAPLSRILTLHMNPISGVDGQITRMFHTRIDTIITGCLLALCLRSTRLRRFMNHCSSFMSAGMLATIALVIVALENSRSQRFDLSIGLTLESFLLGYIIYFSIQNAGTVWGRLLNSRVFRHIGVISYSLYLWQQLFTGSHTVLHSYPLLLFTVIFATGELSYWLVERSSVLLRDWFDRWRIRTLASRVVRMPSSGQL